jgi:hypothetical protein
MSEDLVKVGSPLTVPDFLKGETSGEGLEGMSSRDVVLPRLCLCQSLSPQRKESNPLFIDGLKEGQLFNSVSSRIYGRKLEVIPLLFAKARIYFKKMEEGGGIICQSLNGIDGGSICKTCDACPNSKFGSDSSKAPACNLFYNYPAIVVETGELIVVSLKSTGLKTGRQWNSRMKMLGGRPAYAGVYEINTIETKNSKGEFFLETVKFSRFVTEAEYNRAKIEFGSIQGKNVVADTTGLDDEKEEVDEDIPF